MSRCEICHVDSPLTSSALSVCGSCLRESSARSRELVEQAHARVRQCFGLPAQRPEADGVVACGMCVNTCRPPEGAPGLCGVRGTESGSVRSRVASDGMAAVKWYHDPLPANCCAFFVCPGCSSHGYPEYSVNDGIEHGHNNLAVFYYGCTFNCLFCQNWQCRHLDKMGRPKSAEEIAEAVDENSTCICYFGGDPTPQLDHAIRASELARERAKRDGRVMRICWETNGAMDAKRLRRMADLSLESGGCIKFDLKAWNASVHEALCGVPNTRTLENFAYLASRISERPDVPLLIAATLLVPGYVDFEEVEPLARFVASYGRDIPYTFLAFHADFELHDLPATNREQAERCLNAATSAGLTRARVGNQHLLGGL